MSNFSCIADEDLAKLRADLEAARGALRNADFWLDELGCGYCAREPSKTPSDVTQAVHDAMGLLRHRLAEARSETAKVKRFVIDFTKNKMHREWREQLALALGVPLDEQWQPVPHAGSPVGYDASGSEAP